MRRALLSTLAIVLGACSASVEPASCPPGTSADSAGACRLQCERAEACLLSEACVEGLCVPNPTDLPTIELFRATRTSVTRGQSSTVEFVVVGAERIELLRSDDDGTDVSLGIDSGDLSARVEVRRIISDTLVRLEAYRGGRSVAEEITIRMDGANPNEVVIERFAATPESVLPGERVTLSWSTRNATEVSLARNGEQIEATLDTSGTYEDFVSESSIYTLTALGPAGSDEAQAAVDLESTGDGPKVTGLLLRPARIDEGDNAVVKWQTDGAEQVTLAEDDSAIVALRDPGLVADGAWLVHPPPGDHGYRLTAQSPGQAPSSKTEILEVVRRPPAPQLSGVAVEPLVFPQTGEPADLQVRWQVTPGDAAVQVVVDGEASTFTGSGTLDVRPETNRAVSIEVRAGVPGGGVDVRELLAVPQLPEAGGSTRNNPESLDGVARRGRLAAIATRFELDWYELSAPAGGRLAAQLSGDCPEDLRLEVYPAGLNTAPIATDAAQTDGDCPAVEARDLARGAYLLRVSIGGGLMLAGVDYGIYGVTLGPECGDGREQDGEACDDGNRAFGDRCLPNCALDPSYVYRVEETASPFPPAPANAEPLVFTQVGGGQTSAPSVAVITLPRPFPFFGRTFRGVMVYEDGYVAFLPGRAGDAVDALSPIGASFPNALVSVALTDLVLQAPGGVRTWTALDPEGQSERVVISWEDVPSASGGAVRARIELFEDGRVALAYGELALDDAPGLAVGLEGPSGQARITLPACEDVAACAPSALSGRRFVFTPSATGGG